jgi:hypothetical protein
LKSRKDGGDGAHFGEGGTVTFEFAVPAEVVRQVSGGDATEPGHPTFPAAGVRVDVWDMIAALDVAAFADSEGDRQAPGALRKSTGLVAISTRT